LERKIDDLAVFTQIVDFFSIICAELTEILKKVSIKMLHFKTIQSFSSVFEGRFVLSPNPGLASLSKSFNDRLQQTLFP
jgi:hypothetical protein